MKKIILFIFLLNFLNSFSQQVDSIELTTCVNAAIEVFQIQKSLDFNNKSVELQQQNLKTNFLPSIKLEGQATYQSEAIELNLPIPGLVMPEVPLDQYKVYFEINQLIYDGGQTNNYNKILSTTSSENIIKTQIQQKDIENNISKIFFYTILLEKQLQITENQFKTINDQLKTIEIGVKNEIVLPVNYDILYVEKLKIEQKIDEIKIQKNSTLKVLEYYTNLKFTENTKFILPSITLTNENNNSSKTELLRIQSQKLELQNSQLSSSRRPNVYAFIQGGYGRPGLNMLSSDFSPYFFTGVKFSWKIYDWNNTKRSKEMNIFKSQIIDIEQQNISISNNIQKENILSQINSFSKNIEKDKEIIKIQEKIIKTYNSQLENGIIKASDYVIELNKLTQAKLMLELHLIQLEQKKFEFNNFNN